MDKIEELEKEIAWMKFEKSLLPSSRRRMMQRTVLASYERDLYKALCIEIAPERVAEVDLIISAYAEANGLVYVLAKSEEQDD